MGSLVGQRLRLLLGIIAALAGLWFVYTVRGILAPFILAFILAYLLTPFVDRMEARGLKRTPSILLIFVVRVVCVLCCEISQVVRHPWIECVVSKESIHPNIWCMYSIFVP